MTHTITKGLSGTTQSPDRMRLVGGCPRNKDDPFC